MQFSALALIENRCPSRQVLDTRALGGLLRGRAVSVASSYICDSVYAEAVAHVQRMDVRGEGQRSQAVEVYSDLAIAGEAILRLA